ncbi:hypothetical protein ACPB9E_20265 [Streptomyces exfoliatus]|uniref:hypothetical protein n=1 Tax=Streptomyces exfoliatus TaxID=1905 RepID=UPI003C2F1F12
MALVSAVATLLAALFFCLGAGPGAGTGTGTDAHHPRADAVLADAVRAHAVRADASRGSAVVREYVCPYDRGGCSLFPSLSPAVLSAPPLDPPLHAEGGRPRLDPPSDDGPARRSCAQPRAPDLHVLQVLRT